MRIHFFTDTKSYKFPTYAIAKRGELPVDAVARCISRAAKCTARIGRKHSWTDSAETYLCTLTRKKESRRGGFSVISEFRLTVSRG